MSGVRISGFAINVGDLDRSAAFYTEGLGLVEKGRYDLGHLDEVLMSDGEGDVSILLVKHAGRDDPPDVGTGYEKIVLACDDVAATHERAVSAGAASELAPRSIESLRLTVAMVRDPDGYLIELVKQD